jgi:Chaperone of endosialidase
MRLLSALSSLIVVLSSSAISAQPSQSVSQSVPRLINITGVFRPADGLRAGPVETVTLSIYADPEGGVPLWQETQTVAIDAQGRYSLLLGATGPDGIPAAVLGGDSAHWLGRVFERAGEVEGPRTRLTSVPYALRAADADTLGGRPASAYVLAPTAGETDAAKLTSATPGSSSDIIVDGTPGFLAKYTSVTDIGNSAIFESGGHLGVGTTLPQDSVHVLFNNTDGAVTGLAVQNVGNTANSYSGMLFYDQLGALGQFQGFNNVTHEYRINNIARVSPGGAFNGSINFMLGGASKFIVAPNGNIGIGTTGPSALLEVSNAVPGGPANMWMTSYTNAVNPYYMARRARGTPGAPTAVQNNDGLAGFYGDGYGTTAFGPGFAGGITVQAAQNWTDTAHGTALTFMTTAINSTSPVTRMTLDASGNLGIGTTTTPAAGILEVSNAASTLPFGQVTTSTYVASGQGSLFVGRKARGTAAAPAAVQNGDVLAGLLGRGYGATNFNGTGSGSMLVRAAETWTDAAQGTSLAFNTTAIGTNVPTTRMTIADSGFVGIGTPAPNGMLDIVRNGTANMIGRSYGGEGSGFKGQAARGTFAAPTATQFGDELAEFTAAGYGTTGFNETAGWAAFAAENWTDTAQGTALGFYSTPIGTNEAQLYLGILENGNIGVGTPADVNGFPTATDKLQVFGDARVGNAGTNGCLMNFAGTGIAGTCASDRRFKKDITPFGSVLNQLTALQPVHYYWRAEDFPNRHFGNSRSYGLIAQDVEQVLPELVAIDSDGYKAVDYSQLPLLTIQAVKELKTENDVLKQRVAEVDSLKQRVTELERMIAAMLAATRR